MELLYTTHYHEFDMSDQGEHHLWFFGDIHRDKPSCDVDRWKSDLSDMKKVADKSLFIGMGDYHDFGSTKEKKIMKDLHRDSLDELDRIAWKKNRELYKEMDFMKGKVIGFVSGNHEWISLEGKTSTDDLAERFNTVNLGWLAFIHLSCKIRKGRTFGIDLAVCHGIGGGRLPGATINTVNRLREVAPSMDIYVMGHDHQRAAHPQSILLPQSPQGGEFHMKQRRQWLCRSGSYKKAYNPNSHAYEVSRLLKPADLGCLHLTFKLERTRREGGKDTRSLNLITKAIL